MTLHTLPIRKSDIEKEIAQLQRKLDRLNDVPADTFAIGSILLLKAANREWYIRKVATDAWISSAVGGEERAVQEHILRAEESNIGSFDVFELRPRNVAFFTYTVPPGG